MLLLPIITTRELKRDGHTRRASGIYYGSSSDFTDIVNFWNLRAEDTESIFMTGLLSPNYNR